jgi:hypothetical protein
MRALQSAFPRIKQTIWFDETDESKSFLIANTLLNNFGCWFEPDSKQYTHHT